MGHDFSQRPHSLCAVCNWGMVIRLFLAHEWPSFRRPPPPKAPRQLRPPKHFHPWCLKMRTPPQIIAHSQRGGPVKPYTFMEPMVFDRMPSITAYPAFHHRGRRHVHPVRSRLGCMPLAVLLHVELRLEGLMSSLDHIGLGSPCCAFGTSHHRPAAWSPWR